MLLISFASLALLVGALVDIITRQDGQVRHLPKLVWVLIVVLLPLVGSVLWFAIGREYEAPTPRDRRVQRVRAQPASARTDRPAPGPTTEEQLVALEQEIEFHREQDRIRRLEAEIEARRKLSE